MYELPCGQKFETDVEVLLHAGGCDTCRPDLELDTPPLGLVDEISDLVGDLPPTRCPQAWPGGLSPTIVQLTGGGILVECKYQPLHRGKHRNDDRKDLMEWWGGKLSDEEMAVANALRARVPL